MSHDFRVIQGCPVPKLSAPYLAIILNDAVALLDSAYRGDDARPILNRHGKHSQFQIYNATPAERAEWGILGQPNRPGRSTHELKSDGVAYPDVPVGHDLAWWQLGFDVADADVERVIRAAARYGWVVFRPYPSGVEHHHLNFRRQPRPTPRTAMRILRLRATLPRR